MSRTLTLTEGHEVAEWIKYAKRGYPNISLNDIEKRVDKLIDGRTRILGPKRYYECKDPTRSPHTLSSPENTEQSKLRKEKEKAELDAMKVYREGIWEEQVRQEVKDKKMDRLQ